MEIPGHQVQNVVEYIQYENRVGKVVVRIEDPTLRTGHCAAMQHFRTTVR